jgi:hypothetical protein
MHIPHIIIPRPREDLIAAVHLLAPHLQPGQRLRLTGEFLDEVRHGLGHGLTSL